MQDRIEILHAAVVESEASESILDDGILDIILAKLCAQLGVLGDVDALIVHEHAGAGILDALDKRSNDSLLLAENSCVRHVYTSG